MYTDRKTAPLAYHNFIKYYCLPIGSIYSVLGLWLYIESGYALGIVAYSCSILLHVFALLGLLKWRTYGIECLLAGIMLTGIIFLSTLNYVGSVACAAFLTIVVAYYAKRAVLFENTRKSYTLASLLLLLLLFAGLLITQHDRRSQIVEMENDYDFRTYLANSRKRLIADGTMSGYEFDQGVRAIGHSACLDLNDTAFDYYIDVDCEQVLVERGIMQEDEWHSLSFFEQRAVAAYAWNGMPDKLKTDYIEFFAKTAISNPEIAKFPEEVFQYQGIASVVPKVICGIVANTVKLTDAVAGAISGRSRMWNFTGSVVNFTDFIMDYGRSSQSYLTECISLTSDVGAFVLFAYTVISIVTCWKVKEKCNITNQPTSDDEQVF